MADVLALFAESVNAARSGDPERMAVAEREWRANVPKRQWHPDDDFEPNDDEATRELTDGEYDRIADQYERNWV